MGGACARSLLRTLGSTRLRSFWVSRTGSLSTNGRVLTTVAAKRRLWRNKIMIARRSLTVTRPIPLSVEREPTWNHVRLR